MNKAEVVLKASRCWHGRDVDGARASLATRAEVEIETGAGRVLGEARVVVGDERDVGSDTGKVGVWDRSGSQQAESG